MLCTGCHVTVAATTNQKGGRKSVVVGVGVGDTAVTPIMGASGTKLKHVKKENPVNTWMIQEDLGSGSYGKVSKVGAL